VEIQVAATEASNGATPIVAAPAVSQTVAGLKAGSTGAEGDPVKARVLTLVAEKTGYPVDMLDLDLDLEADLGVDTVKQAEMFAAIREIYNIPRDENRKLRDYPTLAHVIRFVYEQRPDLASVATPEQQPTVQPTPLPATPAAAPAVQEQFASVSSPPADTVKESIKEKVLEIVAEKTGYPKDMLDLDLDLEADLGIDTVKQAEMFASIRAAYNIPRDENLKLRDFPTLAHVIKFAQDRSGLVSSAPAPQPDVTKTAAPPPLPKALPALGFEAANAIPRRVPVPLLRPPLDLCKTSTATLDRGCRVVLMPDQGGVADALVPLLEAKGVNVLRLDRNANAEQLEKTLNTWIAAGSVHGVYWLPALDYEGDLQKMTPEVWRESVQVRI
jgi:acyl carrier protein